MARIKWKPFMKFREDGSSYAIGDSQLNREGDGSEVLRKIIKLPKGEPVSFQQGFILVSEHVNAIFDLPDGGKQVVKFLKDYGFFPEALVFFGKHIEIKAEDFIVLDEKISA